MREAWLDELKQIVLPGQISVDENDLQQHSYDWWPVAIKWKQQGKQPYRPEVVVRPSSGEQIAALLAWASRRGVAVTPWGAGSAVTGAALPTYGGLILDLSTMQQVLALDETNLLVKVQAGKMGHLLEQELNKRGYTLNHSPQSLDRSTVGGWISTRATGQFSSRWGGIEDLVVAFSVVLPTGETVETRLTPRAAVGPDLRHIFMGAEGTMGVITDATLKIFPLPECRLFEAVQFDTVEAGINVMRRFMQAGLRPFLVRYYDQDEARHAMRNPDFSGCVMFLGFEGIEAVAAAEYEVTITMCREAGGQQIGSDAVEAWMKRRFDFSTVENILARPGGVAETIEVAHFWDSILDTYYALKETLRPLADEVLGHFSHVYPQGTSLYMILLGQVEDDELAETRILQIWKTAMGVSLARGAVISHHHGVGLTRMPYIRQDLGTSALVLERLKSALDPAGILNPGKLGLSQLPGQFRNKRLAE